jgi:hypothetical protein
MSTREAAQKLSFEHPDWNMADIARELGVSRERIRQLIGEEKRSCRNSRDYPTRKQAPAEYQAYANAKQRCTNPSHSLFEWYGARGIEFRFENFRQWWLELGPKPTPNLTVDRRNNDGHYEPGNVRWVTMKVQANNRRSRWR